MKNPAEAHVVPYPRHLAQPAVLRQNQELYLLRCDDGGMVVKSHAQFINPRLPQSYLQVTDTYAEATAEVAGGV